ncbi:MAG TPA: hypothetical protein VNS32_21925 [Flavisolibacter sp.]|nr:hypothetical protein [Flavisolibacter sp.]
MKEKTIISTVTLFTSLLAYWYAREAEKDSVPYVMMGGFLGSIIGDALAEKVTKSNNNN